MQDFLAKLIGKKIDIFCDGALSLRGEVLKVEAGVLHLRDDEGKHCYIAVDKINVIWEASGDQPRAGFVPQKGT